MDVSKVEYAVLETNGKLSTFLYPEHAPLTPGDLKIKTETQEFPVAVISNGRVLSENLSALGLDPHWLQKKLNGLAPQGVFLMTATKQGSCVIIRKESAP